MKRSTLSSSPLCEQKQKIRRKKHRQIEELTEQYIRESDDAILNKLLCLEELNNTGTVFLYHSVGREVSTVRLIERLLESGKGVSLPVSGEGGTMEFYPLDSLSELTPGKFGIPEPPVTRPVRHGGNACKDRLSGHADKRRYFHRCCYRALARALHRAPPRRTSRLGEREIIPAHISAVLTD